MWHASIHIQHLHLHQFVLHESFLSETCVQYVKLQTVPPLPLSCMSQSNLCLSPALAMDDLMLFHFSCR